MEINNFRIWMALAFLFVLLIVCAFFYLKTKFQIKVEIKKIPGKWDAEKAKLDHFWKTYFGMVIPWKKLRIPKGPDDAMTLEYIPEELTIVHVLAVFQKLYPNKKLQQWYANYRVLEYEPRKVAPRLVRHHGLQSPDTEQTLYIEGIAYGAVDDFKRRMPYTRGIYTMLPIETLIAALRFQTETGKSYDVEGITVFNAQMEWLTEDGSPKYNEDWMLHDYRMDDIFKYPGGSVQNGRYVSRDKFIGKRFRLAYL